MPRKLLSLDSLRQQAVREALEALARGFKYTCYRRKTKTPKPPPGQNEAIVLKVAVEFLGMVEAGGAASAKPADVTRLVEKYTEARKNASSEHDTCTAENR